MSSSRAGGGSGSAAIPANARKTVQSLREIVPNSEDEIYAMLKECNMDANETVQRLLNQDPFHEVKRRRDKKKEGNKDAADNRSRPASGGQGRGGGRGNMMDRGSGRGSTLPRHNTSEFNGGRGKSFAPRENGSVNTRASSTYSGPSSSTTAAYGQQKPYPSGVSNAAPASAAASTTTGNQNGSTGFSRPASVPQSTWGASASGHATMADIVKANGAPPAPPVPPSAVPSTTPVGTPLPPSVPQQYTPSPTSPSPSVSSGVYSSSTDPVLHPSLDPRATGTPGAIKREVGTVGPTRPKQDWPTSSLNMDSSPASAVSSQTLQIPQASIPSSVAAPSLELDNQTVRPNSPPPASVSPPVIQDRPASLPISTETSVGIQTRQGASAPSSATPVSRSVVVGGPFSTRPVYQPQQHPVGTQKASGAGLEWKPKPTVTSSTNMGGVNTPSQSDSVRSSPPSGSVDSVLSAQASKLQSLNIHDDQPVIIPNHLQVPEAERTHLSFGSFGAGFGTSFPTSFVTEEKPSTATAESIPVVETAVEPQNPPSVASPTPALSQNYVHQSISVPEENLVANIDTAVVSMAPPSVQQPELPKADPVVHQTTHYNYLPTVPNYAGFSLMPQIPAGQYTYEPAETPPQDVTRLPGLMPYTDPTTSYYTPPFRPTSDGDARYPAFITSNASSKYNGNLGLINLAGQGLSSSQETVNTGMPPSVSTTQTSQTGTAQTVQTIPQQQPLPLHAYPGQPGGAPIQHFTNMFGYQYIPPSFAYMPTHAPYQHNYTTTSGYPQPPTANSYPPAAASSYAPAGAATVKYLSQYKPGTATGSAPHSAAAQGYGGYATAPSGYAANPTVTGGSATGYDDVGVPQQYKDNNLYIPNQQAEGSTVWIQAQLSRDMAAAGMQTSSYYNLGQQGQHTYAHTQQPSHAHAHPGYASLYHPSQSGPAPTAHQLLQQPQSLGAQGAGGAQAGGYQQQPQRTQQTWANNY